MRFYFRPLLGLTVLTVIFLAILLSLGTWQYHRLQWKTDLLAEIEEAATAPLLRSVLEVQDLLDDGKPVDFRRISLDVQMIPIKDPFLVYQSQRGGVFWRPYIPVKSGVTQMFLAWYPVVSDSEKDFAIIAPMERSDVLGYVRLARPASRFTPKSTPEENRWFSFNPLPKKYNWDDAVSGSVETRFYVDAVGAEMSSDQIPPKQPDIRNNHLDYMLTWYSFALIWLIIYFILHHRRGRFGCRNKS